MNYPLRVNKSDPKLLYPTISYNTVEAIQRTHSFYLTTDYVKDDWSDSLHRYYRLHSTKPHSIDMALGYEIECPECHRTKMRQIGRSLNAYDLGLYYCPDCDRRKFKR